MMFIKLIQLLFSRQRPRWMQTLPHWPTVGAGLVEGSQWRVRGPDQGRSCHSPCVALGIRRLFWGTYNSRGPVVTWIATEVTSQSYTKLTCIVLGRDVPGHYMAMVCHGNCGSFATWILCCHAFGLYQGIEAGGMCGNAGHMAMSGWFAGGELGGKEAPRIYF